MPESNRSRAGGQDPRNQDPRNQDPRNPEARNQDPRTAASRSAETSVIETRQVTATALGPWPGEDPLESTRIVRG
jgi:hypothetical protein